MVFRSLESKKVPEGTAKQNEVNLKKRYFDRCTKVCLNNQQPMQIKDEGVTESIWHKDT